MKSTTRRYDEVVDRVAEPVSRAAPREERMQAVVDALWDAFRDTGVSWVGFYLDVPDAPDDERLVLGPRRDKPACSPIGLHGVCGQALRASATRIVDDVRTLGEAYVACDPRDLSEIVIALLDADGVCWGVLDLDSQEVAAFGAGDEEGLTRVLVAAGLHVPR